MFNMGMLMEQIQAEITALQNRLENTTFEGAAHAGKVKAWANGLQMLVALDVSPEIIRGLPPAELSEAVVAACNAALKQARLELNKEIARLTGGNLELGRYPNLD
ncbi:MAG TPA: YbaB/EbfC family nucleoid-associated protein [Firmicutes bacterium]|nr:YbaB/EbfC family nucleoid-associated protein [Bacillota bacterium]